MKKYIIKNGVKQNNYIILRLSVVTFHLSQGSATYGMRAKRGTQNDFQWHAE
jgi:hypothetical protein